MSASLCPDSWERVARIGGSPTLTLSFPNAVFLDAHAMSDSQTHALMDWGISEGFVRPDTWFKTWYWDDESEDWAYMAFSTREAAEHETEDRDPEDGPDGFRIQEVSGFVLTDAGAALLPRLPRSPIFVEDAVLMLYVRLNAEQTVLCGVFWNEDDRPEMLTAPRYAILPEALLAFSVSGPHGDLPFMDYVQRSAQNDEFAVSL